MVKLLEFIASFSFAVSGNNNSLVYLSMLNRMMNNSGREV
jgi:hypothetical protein